MTKEKHWMEDDETRKRFWAYAKGDLGLTEDEAHEALSVASTKDFGGDKDMARAMLKAYAADIDSHRLVKSLKPQDPTHSEARTIAFLDMFAPDGTRIAVTAREGATADTVALTALALWDGAQILARLDWTLAAENGKEAKKRLAVDPPSDVDWHPQAGPPPPPTATAAPAAQTETGNGGGELLTEFVKITAPKGKPVVEFWRPNRQYSEIRWYLGGEALLQIAPTLVEAGWTAEHFDAVGQEYTMPLKIVWVQSPKDAKYKDITAVTLR